MSELTDAVGAMAGGAVGANPISAIANVAAKIIDLFPNPEQKVAAQLGLQQVQLQYYAEQTDLQKTQMNDASQNILHDGLGGVRKVFGYSFVGLLIWNYAVVPVLHKAPIDIPGAFTLAFTTLLLGTSAMNLAQRVSAMPGDSSVSILGVKVGNKS